MNIRELWRRILGYEAREERELAEWSKQRQEEEDRETKRREALESDAEFMVALKRVAQTVFAIPKEARFTMVGPRIRILQIPLDNKPPRMGGHRARFNAENIELQPLPSWFMGKFYDFCIGYGPESKLVAWRIGEG